MGIQQALTRVLMNWLPTDEQARMATDVVSWLCADLPPAEQQEKIEYLGPRLLGRIRQGRFGLPLLVYHHLLCLPPLCWLRRPVVPMDSPPGGQLARLGICQSHRTRSERGARIVDLK